MNTSLYISDLDGTLLDDESALTEFSRDTLRDLLGRGLTFTVASARSVVSMGSLLSGLKLTLPVIELNGAFLSDLATGRHETVNSIEPAIAEDIYGLLPQFGCVPFISTFDGAEDCVYYNEIVNEGMRWYRDDRLAKNDRRWRRADNLTRAFRDQVVCLTVIGESGTLSEIGSAIGERHGTLVELHHFENQYSPGWYWLTIHDWRATKDQAIRTLMDTYGLSERELVVFGDQGNDIKMFQAASRAVAVANASAELKRHATQVIGSNTEDSVAKFIRDDFASARTA